MTDRGEIVAETSGAFRIVAFQPTLSWDGR
jgi:hypothetical protein